MPYRFDEKADLTTDKACGSHFIYPKENSIEFLLNGESSCIVETQLMNIIYVRMFWDMPE